MPRAQTLGVSRASAEDVELDGLMVPSRLRVQSLGLGDEPDMLAELEVREGVPHCVSLVWRTKPDGAAISTEHLHEIADLESYVRDAFLRYPRVIAEFRATGGTVGGQFEGAPITLVHHRDRATGREYVAPIFYLREEGDDTDRVYVFAANAGAPEHPNWYFNVVAAGRVTIELGTETYEVAVEEIVGAERDRVYAKQAERFPGFAEYERVNAGRRTIPVLSLTRAAA